MMNGPLSNFANGMAYLKISHFRKSVSNVQLFIQIFSLLKTWTLFYVFHLVIFLSLIAGTSNWAGDYFLTTGGIGLAIDGSNLGNQSDIRKQLASVFERDWYSEYAFPLDHFNVTKSQT